MESSSQLLIALALILLASRLASQLASRLGLPSVFGVLVAGVVLGPGVTGLVEITPVLEGMSHIGVILLLFVAGLETDVVEMRRVGLAATLAAIGGVILPMAGGAALVYAFGFPLSEAVFVGAILTATSVTVSAHVLREMGYLQSRVGSAILGAAVIDDVIGVVVLTIVVSVESGGSLWELGRLALFLPVALLGGHWIVNWSTVRLHRLEGRDHRFIEVLALVLAFSWVAQAVGGLAAISGAYLAGVLFSRTLLQEDLADFGNLIGYALFAPVFFVTTGMMADLRMVATEPGLAVLLTIVAIAAKAIGSGVGATAGGFDVRESMAVGAGMVARGEVALVIAVLGQQTGVISNELFSASIVVTLLTTLAAPLMLRVVLPQRAPETLEGRRARLVAQMERLEA